MYRNRDNPEVVTLQGPTQPLLLSHLPAQYPLLFSPLTQHSERTLQIVSSFLSYKTQKHEKITAQRNADFLVFLGRNTTILEVEKVRTNQNLKQSRENLGFDAKFDWSRRGVSSMWLAIDPETKSIRVLILCPGTRMTDRINLLITFWGDKRENSSHRIQGLIVEQHWLLMAALEQYL